MRRLIRFEDAYGLADLVCLVQQLGYIPLIADKEKNSLKGINTITLSEKEETYVECGTSFPTVLSPKDEWIANLIHYQIDELIIVFDMDEPSGKGIISSAKLHTYITELEDRLKKQNININVRYVPAVWVAETFAMYILLQDYKHNDVTKVIVEPTELVHKLNTARFHARIVQEVLNHRGIDKRAKHLREYISNKEIAVQGLEKVIRYYANSINERVLKWILYDDVNSLFNGIEVVKHQQDIENYFQLHQPDVNEKFTLYGKIEIDLNKKCW